MNSKSKIDPRISATMFVIAVNDLHTSVQYYRDVLGFEIHEIGDDGWRFFKKDSCTIMAGHCPDALPPASLGDHSYFAYLEMENIDAYYQFVQARGAKILKKLCDEPWGMREFALKTNDGHRIMFGQDISDKK